MVAVVLIVFGWVYCMLGPGTWRASWLLFVACWPFCHGRCSYPTLSSRCFGHLVDVLFWVVFLFCLGALCIALAMAFIFCRSSVRAARAAAFQLLPLALLFWACQCCQLIATLLPTCPPVALGATVFLGCLFWGSSSVVGCVSPAATCAHRFGCVDTYPWAPC